VHEDKEEILTISLIVKKYPWIIFIPVCAILSFIFWQIGQEAGADLGRFIYNLKH